MILYGKSTTLPLRQENLFKLEHTSIILDKYIHFEKISINVEFFFCVKPISNSLNIHQKKIISVEEHIMISTPNSKDLERGCYTFNKYIICENKNKKIILFYFSYLSNLD